MRSRNRPACTPLVMELIAGEDLSQRIARGAILIDEALPIAKQIADAGVDRPAVPRCSLSIDRTMCSRSGAIGERQRCMRNHHVRWCARSTKQR